MPETNNSARSLPPDRAIESRYVGRRRQTIELPFVKNQAPQGEEVQCCVSAAIASVMEYYEPGTAELAMLYHYYMVRKGLYSIGMGLIEGLREAQWGICELDYHPYEVDFHGAQQKPSFDAQSNAKNHELKRYLLFQASRDISSWKSHLSDGNPLILVFRLYKDLYFSIPENDNKHPALTQPLSSLFHCVVVVGFEDNNREFYIQDCRGNSWANNGLWRLPYDLAKSGLFTDAVCVIRQI